MGKATGNPKGRPPGALNKVTADIKALAQVHSEKAIERLAYLMENGQSETAVIAACSAILDRAHGKPKQSLDVDANVKAAIQTVERLIVKAPNTNG
jgi:Ni,Fe-hydrogenase maturation factor